MLQLCEKKLEQVSENECSSSLPPSRPQKCPCFILINLTLLTLLPQTTLPILCWGADWHLQLVVSLPLTLLYNHTPHMTHTIMIIITILTFPFSFKAIISAVTNPMNPMRMKTTPTAAAACKRNPCSSQSTRIAAGMTSTVPTLGGRREWERLKTHTHKLT